MRDVWGECANRHTLIEESIRHAVLKQVCHVSSEQTCWLFARRTQLSSSVETNSPVARPSRCIPETVCASFGQKRRVMTSAYSEYIRLSPCTWLWFDSIRTAGNELG